jgi:hypothetical protein
MHEFAYFITIPFYMNYTKYRQEYTLEYICGGIVGIIVIGLLVGSLLKNKIYVTLALLHILLMIYIVISFKYDDEITDNPTYMRIIATFLGFDLETSNFIYICILPLIIARDITNHKLKSFSRQLLDPNTHSFVGTVVGSLIGTVYILDTIAFANLNFVFQDIFSYSPQMVCLTVSIILLMAIFSIYKEIKRELLLVPCIRKRFPKKLRSYTVTRDIDA